MKVIYVHTDGTVKEEAHTKCPSFNTLSKFVDGPIEAFDMKVEVKGFKKPVNARVYVNEIGQVIDLPVNKILTHMVVKSGQLMGTPYIQLLYGNAVITQPDDKE